MTLNPKQTRGTSRLAARFGSFLLLMGQLVLLTWVIQQLVVQQDPQTERFGLVELMPWIVAGFGVWYWTPLTWRMPVFLLISLIGFFVLFDGEDALFMILYSALLVGLACLPLRVIFRILLVAAAGSALLLMRIQELDISNMEIIVPILASMFMFRMVLFLHEQQFEEAKVPLITKASYFFMLPNVAFSLFPVVDYKGFVKHHVPNNTLSQRGLRLMTRGVLHLMLYRVLYNQLLPDSELAGGLLDVLHYMVVKYAMIIRLSGFFHISVGVLCLFGFNLPEVFRNYFLASGFSDLWRRINIYWRDFVTKVFYYPIFFRLRFLGNTRAMVISILLLFAITWQLHSWQWFWLLGDFPFLLQDGVFWGLFGLLVAANALLQQRRSPPKVSGWQWHRAWRHCAQILGMFLFMSVLWSFWTYSTPDAWLQLVRVALSSSWSEYATVGVIAGALLVTALGVHFVVHQPALKRLWVVDGFRGHMLLTLGMMLPLVLFSMPRVQGWLAEHTNWEILEIANGEFNKIDKERQVAGYYDKLVLRNDPTSPMLEMDQEDIEEWDNLYREGGLILKRDVLQRYLKPSVDLYYKGGHLTTNRWAMRDKEYEREKPPHTFRFVLLGGSDIMGAGVDDDQVCDAILEKMLNAHPQAARSGVRVEILNLSVIGYHAIQKAKLMEERVPFFQPDAVLYVSPEREEFRITQKIPKMLRMGVIPETGYLHDLCVRLGLNASTETTEAKKKLNPHTMDIIQWAYRAIHDSCARQQATPIWVYMPALEYSSAEERQEFRRTSQLARNVGFEIMDLTGVYGDVPHAQLKLSEFDKHPNARGHRMIALRMYDEIVRLAPTLGLWANDSLSLGTHE